MASKIFSSHTVKATRGFAAQAAANATAEFSVVPREAAKTTTLSNGVVVASIETNAPLSRVAIAYKAGSRNDTLEGTAHALRSASALSTTNSSQFALVRTLQEAGAAMTCTGGREHTMYTVDATRQNIEATLSKLADVATAPAFKPWELADNAALMKLDNAGLTPQVIFYWFVNSHHIITAHADYLYYCLILDHSSRNAAQGGFPFWIG